MTYLRNNFKKHSHHKIISRVKYFIIVHFSCDCNISTPCACPGPPWSRGRAWFTRTGWLYWGERSTRSSRIYWSERHARATGNYHPNISNPDVVKSETCTPHKLHNRPYKTVFHTDKNIYKTL